MMAGVPSVKWEMRLCGWRKSSKSLSYNTKLLPWKSLGLWSEFYVIECRVKGIIKGGSLSFNRITRETTWGAKEGGIDDSTVGSIGDWDDVKSLNEAIDINEVSTRKHHRGMLEGSTSSYRHKRWHWSYCRGGEDCLPIRTHWRHY